MTGPKHITRPIPGALALLGRAVAVRVGAGAETDLGRSLWLAAHPRGRVLYIGPDSKARLSRTPTGEQARAASKLRSEFSGQLDGRAWWLSGFPTAWIRWGTARTIVYRSDKTNGGGTGRSEDFIHEFSPGAVAYTGGEYIMIVGDKIRVDASGVRN